MDTVAAALARQGQSTKSINRWYDEMPREQEMLPKDKYTIFDKKERRYRKSIHSMCWIPGGLVGSGTGYCRDWVSESLSSDVVAIYLAWGRLIGWS